MESGDLSQEDESLEQTDKVPSVHRDVLEDRPTPAAIPASTYRPRGPATPTARAPAKVAPRPVLPFSAPKLEIPPLFSTSPVAAPARVPSGTIPPRVQAAPRTVLPVPAVAKVEIPIIRPAEIAVPARKRRAKRGARPSPRLRAILDRDAEAAAYDENAAPREFGKSMLVRARKSRAKLFFAIALLLAGLATAWLLLRDDAKSSKPAAAPAHKA
jgi:hypothetical protein